MPQKALRLFDVLWPIRFQLHLLRFSVVHLTSGSSSQNLLSSGGLSSFPWKDSDSLSSEGLLITYALLGDDKITCRDAAEVKFSIMVLLVWCDVCSDTFSWRGAETIEFSARRYSSKVIYGLVYGGSSPSLTV